MPVARFANFLARSFLIFLVSYLWLSFYLRDIIFVFLISFAITAAVNLIYYLFKKKSPRRVPAAPVLRKYQITTDDAKVNIFPFFKTAPIERDLVSVINSADKDARVYIAAKSFTPAIKKSAKAKKISLLTYQSRAHMLLHLIKITAFRRKKVRGYVFMGLIILATSFIVRFNIYYIVIATIMFSFAIISLFELPFTRDNTFTR